VAKWCGGCGWGWELIWGYNFWDEPFNFAAIWNSFTFINFATMKFMNIATFTLHLHFMMNIHTLLLMLSYHVPYFVLISTHGGP
jgi:hypothetical protein